MLQISLIVGALAALLMFSGDMLLYFSTEDYHSDGKFESIIAIMEKIPDWRLMLGGLLGPISAFFYCIGFYHITLVVVEKYQTLAFATMLLCSLGMIISGAYHSHCTYLGLIAKTGSRVEMEKVIKYIKILSGISFLFLAIGLLLIGGIILLGRTYYPRWFFLLTPIILYFLKYVWKKVPQPFLIVLYGGWYNLMFVIYFLAGLMLSFQF